MTINSKITPATSFWCCVVCCCCCCCSKLGLFLPHPVDSKNTKAQFNSESETLSVTLRLNRMLDFINF